MEVELPRSPEAADRARRCIGQRFGGHVHDDAMGALETVVSELVNNAVVHGEGRITLKAGWSEDCVRVEVIDEGSGNAPAIRRRAEFESGGWGLQIVQALSERWGAHQGTTHVWAEVLAR